MVKGYYSAHFDEKLYLVHRIMALVTDVSHNYRTSSEAWYKYKMVKGYYSAHFDEKLYLVHRIMALVTDVIHNYRTSWSSLDCFTSYVI